jgi:histidinol-phosphate phosphatase family protein
MTAAPLRVEPYAVVVPTVGRPSLDVLLSSLVAHQGPLPVEVVVVDDRAVPDPPLDPASVLLQRVPVRVVPGWGRGPAAARNLGWRLVSAPWVVFLDDDVVLPEDWKSILQADLAAAGPRVGGIQGRLVVPLPRHQRPTDWERSTAGLEAALWATADMAYRRECLLAVDGFDERFPRAYREDADLALRVRRAGWSLVRGARTTVHPVRPADDGVSLRVQRGNADDALMRRLHGPQWRAIAGTGRGRLRQHLATTGLGVAGLAGLAASRWRGGRLVGLAAAVGWASLSAEFAWHRIAPGPRDRDEVVRMLWTSAAIPPVAVWHRARGWWVHRGTQAWPPRTRAVLFDRDGTLVHDVPYNGDPARVRPVEGAAEAVARLRAHGLRLGVVSNQSGVARGLLTTEQVSGVNAEVDSRIGPFDTWQVCPHGPEDGCACRKPRPGMVRRAARALGVRPEECVVVGDIGADVAAAQAAGARSVMVPNGSTRPEEVAAAPVVVTDLGQAVDLIVGSGRG